MKILKTSNALKKLDKKQVVANLIEKAGDFVSKKQITELAYGKDPTPAQKKVIQDGLNNLRQKGLIKSWRGTPVTYGLLVWSETKKP